MRVYLPTKVALTQCITLVLKRTGWSSNSTSEKHPTGCGLYYRIVDLSRYNSVHYYYEKGTNSRYSVTFSYQRLNCSSGYSQLSSIHHARGCSDLTENLPYSCPILQTHCDTLGRPYQELITTELLTTGSCAGRLSLEYRYCSI